MSHFSFLLFTIIIVIIVIVIVIVTYCYHHCYASLVSVLALRGAAEAFARATRWQLALTTLHEAGGFEGGATL